MSIHDKCLKITQAITQLERAVKALEQEHYVPMDEVKRDIEKMKNHFKDAKDSYTTKRVYQTSPSIQAG